MTPSRGWIEATMMRIQEDFLENPALSLTSLQVRRRYGLDLEAAEAMLGALLDAGVLARRTDGSYLKFFPHGADLLRYASAPHAA